MLESGWWGKQMINGEEIWYVLIWLFLVKGILSQPTPEPIHADESLLLLFAPAMGPSLWEQT